MKIKRFFAKDMRTAMSEVKKVLGDQAVIMSNKQVVGGIEIVAAIDYTNQSKEVQNTPSANDLYSNLQDDTVSLSSQKNIIKKPDLDTAQVDKQKDESNKEEFAKSLNSFFDKVNSEHVKGFSPLKPRENNRKPRTLGEQQDWQAGQDNTTKLSSQGENFSLNSNPKNRVNSEEIAKIGKEVSSLRKLLEHQLSGLMWQEMERCEPIRAMAIKWLTKSGFSESIADYLASYIPEQASAAQFQAFLPTLLQEKIYTGNDEIISQGGAIALLGPTGAGKTTTIAKLAAKFSMKYGADQVALITTDTYRIGAHDQLATYGKIMGCSVRVAKDADELSTILHQYKDKRLVLIDTAGMGQRDVRLAEQLDTLIENSRVNIRSYLVISATAQRRVVQEAIDHFNQIPLTGCILTKVDESIGLGEALSVTMQQKLPISYITTGQRVPEDIEIATKQRLVDETIQAMNHVLDEELQCNNDLQRNNEFKTV
ncbi:MAG: flagellar biosynthesis protein FlhF [Psychromonas sp.]|nr:flagellar biosynthesis protein FlhF [Psychromonas sp.]